MKNSVTPAPCTRPPVEIAEGVWWVGFHDQEMNLHCNPYLIVDGDEAILIDGGSRSDFPTVMLKILQTGIHPNNICRLIYQHYDPDLCGSIPNLEDFIGNKDLQIISSNPNHMFIRHYGSTSPLVSLSSIDYQFVFKSGRRITFHPTPFCHAYGSLITLDEKTGTLFTSDIFGSFRSHSNFFLELTDECKSCSFSTDECHSNFYECPIPNVQAFHVMNFPSSEILHNTLAQIQRLNFTQIAPQHGNIIKNRQTAEIAIQHLKNMHNIGYDNLKFLDKERKQKIW